jgi:hypothetical protein
MGSKLPYVRIHQHPNQEGRNVPSIEYPKDEIRYSLWLLFNAKTLQEFMWILRSRWGIRGLIRSARSIAIHLLRQGITILFGISK